jgi:DNA polymerase-3 subunit beta
MVAANKATDLVTSSSFVATVSYADLKRASATLNRVADRKSSMPILQHALVRVFDEHNDAHSHLLLVATDLNLTVTIKLDLVAGSERGQGGFALPAKQLADIAKGLPDGDVTLTRRELTAMTVSSANVASVIRGIPDREFPKVPDDRNVAWHRCEASALGSMIDRVLYAVCQDETRFHLNGILYQCSDGDNARTVATDGHRLAKVESKLTGVPVPSAGVIIPSKSAKEISRMLRDGKHKGSCEMAMSADNRVLFVRYGATTLATKLIDAQFPPYEQVIPTEYKILATFERKPLIAALKRAKVACTETRGVKLTLASGKLTLTSDNPDTGSASESLPMGSMFEDGSFSIGVNATYMLEAIEEIDCKDVTIGFNAELDPILVRSTHDAVEHSVPRAPYLCVVMPMRAPKGD